MFRGLPASILLHVCVLAGGTIVLPYTTTPGDSEPAVINIELVSTAPRTNIRPTAPAPEPEVEPEPVEPEPALEDFLDDVDTLPEPEDTGSEDTEPALPEPAAPQPEGPEPAEDPDVLPEAPDPEPEDVEPEPTPEPVEPDPEPEPVDEPEIDPLDSILNTAANRFKSSDNAPSRTPTSSTGRRPLENENVPPQTGVGNRTDNVARIDDIVIAQMKGCWDTVEGLPNPQRLIVTIRVQLKQNGTFLRDVELVDPPRAPLGDRFMGIAIDRALSAARRCQPYRLPADDYDYWKEMTLVIGPDGG